MYRENHLADEIFKVRVRRKKIALRKGKGGDKDGIRTGENA